MPDELHAAKSELALDASEFIRQRQSDELALRSLSIEERGTMIEAACRTAAEISSEAASTAAFPPRCQRLGRPRH